jgi:hypothetical protein
MAISPHHISMLDAEMSPDPVDKHEGSLRRFVH